MIDRVAVALASSTVRVTAGVTLANVSGKSCKNVIVKATTASVVRVRRIRPAVPVIVTAPATENSSQRWQSGNRKTHKQVWVFTV